MRLAPVSVLAVVFASATVPAGAVAASAPAKDTFKGRIVSATGGLSKDRGNVMISIHVTQSAAASRQVQLTISSPACGTATSCVRLSGTLTGTMTAKRSIPDVGRRYSIAGTGRVGPLGKVSATGVVTGTGFISRAHEGLSLTLSTGTGRLTISAVSPEVPGFTSP